VDLGLYGLIDMQKGREQSPIDSLDNKGVQGKKARVSNLTKKEIHDQL